jgi:hypothetical protein
MVASPLLSALAMAYSGREGEIQLEITRDLLTISHAFEFINCLAGSSQRMRIVPRADRQIRNR